MRIPITAKLQSASESCFQLDPIRDPRWAELVDKHPKASVFHSVPWLEALQKTYGYEPVAFTTSDPGGELKNGIALCRINSWLTGRRLVSLPFSDHCEPLCDSVTDLKYLMQYLKALLPTEKRKYFEIRPVGDSFSEISEETGCAPIATYFLHRLGLQPELSQLFQNLDHDSVQRRIERANRAELIEKCGTSDDLLAQFYALFVTTRRRQRVPPTSIAWFRNLITCQQDALKIRLAFKGEIPIAGILTLHFKNVVYYKYGCSDARFNKFGATPWLLWKAITDAKRSGVTEFDLGRSEEDNRGLIAFKNHWVPNPERLTYWRYPYAPVVGAVGDRKLQLAKRVLSVMPGPLVTKIGQLLYPHIG